jgi:membrane protein DedA with SNARE-associated domain
MNWLVMTLVLQMSLPEPVWVWIHRIGGPGLILLGVADNTPFISTPAGSIDVLVVLLAAHRHDWWAYYALMATIGEVIGGYLTYRLAKKGGQATLEKKVGKSRAEKIYRAFEKYGSATVLVGAVLPPPFPFTPLLITAGVMQYPKNKFLASLTAGRALRFFAAAVLGRIYGQQVLNFFSAHYELMLKLLIILAIATAIAAAIYFGWYRPKSKREKQAHSQTSHSSSAR